MDEKALIKQWNAMRTQIITAQVAPALVLIGVFVLAAYDKFSTAPDSAKFLAIGAVGITGILATVSQYAAVREGEALLVDLKKVANPSALSQKIAGSRSMLSVTAIALIGFDLAMTALVVWAVLGN